MNIRGGQIVPNIHNSVTKKLVTNVYTIYFTKQLITMTTSYIEADLNENAPVNRRKPK